MESNNTKNNNWYELVVKETLDPSWESHFSPMRVWVVTSSSNGTSTRICGPIRDQAALFGVIAQIRDLGLSLISVNPLLSNPV